MAVPRLTCRSGRSRPRRNCILGCLGCIFCRLCYSRQPVLDNRHGSNQVASMDFMHDRLADGRSIRVLNVIQDFNSEARPRTRPHNLLSKEPSSANAYPLLQ
ncbi:hypothetical protein CAL14_19715 [Bordetella genomosp. 9]|nr:hypothetical protein CAL14_19715 [Bordetella genomosp. 9]